MLDTKLFIILRISAVTNILSLLFSLVELVYATMLFMAETLGFFALTYALVPQPSLLSLFRLA